MATINRQTWLWLDSTEWQKAFAENIEEQLLLLQGPQDQLIRETRNDVLITIEETQKSEIH